jgi:predicted transcriptional regulator
MGEYEDNRDKVIEHLKSVGGKGADTTTNIGKAIGLKRRDASKLVAQMEQEGILVSTGVTAGVAGYKLK